MSQSSKKEIGAEGECAAKEYLLSLGWKFLNANYFTKKGELDLIFYEGNTLVFVEVKARKKSIGFEDAISKKKVEHLFKAAEIYIDKERPPFEEMRFDAIYVLIDSRGKAGKI
ncbi:MAG: YraN family protein, partial [Brevinema sp.]